MDDANEARQEVGITAFPRDSRSRRISGEYCFSSLLLLLWNCVRQMARPAPVHFVEGVMAVWCTPTSSEMSAFPA